MEIVDLDTLKQVCYHMNDEEILEMYQEINGYQFLNRDFKDIRIKELEDYFDYVKKIQKEFPKMMKDVFDIEMEKTNVEELLKQFLQVLKNRGAELKKKEKNDTEKITENIPRKVTEDINKKPFYKVTYREFSKLRPKSVLRKEIIAAYHILKVHMPKDFHIEVTADHTIETLVHEIVEYKGRKR